MLSIQINPDYLATRKIPATTPLNILLRVPASFTAFSTVFPTAKASDRAVGGMKITTSALTVDDSVVCRLAPDERDCILNSIAKLVMENIITCYDSTASKYRSANDIFAFANSGNWDTIATGTVLLAENNLSDLSNASQALSHLGIPTVTDTLVNILSATVPAAGTRANPTDAPGASLQVGADGKWHGSMGNLTAAQYAAISGSLGNLGAGSTVTVDGVAKSVNGISAMFGAWNTNQLRVGHRVASIGDSITGRIGNPVALASILSKGRIYPVGVYSYPGESTPTIKTHIAKACSRLRPGDILRIQTGTNDAGNADAIAAFEANLTEMVVYALSVGVVPYLSLIPNRADAAVSGAVSLINFRIREVGAKFNLFVVDGWIPTRNSTGGWVSGTSDDKVHPNQHGWDLTALGVLPEGIV